MGELIAKLVIAAGELIAKLVIAAVIALVAYVIGAVVPLEWMHWWVAAIIGLVLSFGGWLIIVDGELFS